MSLGLLDPDVVRPTALARANPVVKLAVTTAVGLALLLTVDLVTAGTATALEAAALPWCGLGPAALRRRLGVVALGAVPAAVLTAVAVPGGGADLLAAGPVAVSTGSLAAGAAVGLRVAAIALPGVVLLATTDPTDLGDALAQVLHLPPRAVLAALAGLRLLEVLAEDWRQLGLARRARGLGDDGPVGRARALGGRAFALLVVAVRRGAVLATAMEARGFGAGTERTWARPSRLQRRDAAVLAGGLGLAAAASAAGVAAGTWHLVLG